MCFRILVFLILFTFLVSTDQAPTSYLLIVFGREMEEQWMGFLLAYTAQVLPVPTSDRMFTTTHLSDHVQDNMTSRLRQPQRVGVLL